MHFLFGFNVCVRTICYMYPTFYFYFYFLVGSGERKERIDLKTLHYENFIHEILNFTRYQISTKKIFWDCILLTTEK